MGKKAFQSLFETDFRKERSPYVVHNVADDVEDVSSCGDKLCPTVQVVSMMGCRPLDDHQLCTNVQPPAPAPKMMNRMDSYRVPPLKTTLETIEEDEPRYEIKPDYLLRSKSLPAQRRSAITGPPSALELLHKMPSYRHNHLAQQGGDHAGDGTFFAGDGTFFDGDGTYFAGDGGFRGREGGYGVTMSGPILSTAGEYKYRAASKRYRPRLSIARMRDAVRHSRLGGALSHILSRMRSPTLRSRAH